MSGIFEGGGLGGEGEVRGLVLGGFGLFLAGVLSGM